MSEKLVSRSQAVRALDYDQGPQKHSRRRVIIGGGIAAVGLGLTSAGINVFGGNKDNETNAGIHTRAQSDGLRLLKDPNIEHKDYQIKDRPEIRKQGAAERDEPILKGLGEGLPSNELGRLRVGDKLYNAVEVIGQPVLVEVGQPRNDVWLIFRDEQGRVGFVHSSNVEPISPEKPLKKI